MCVCMRSCFNHVQLFATPWIVACQAPLSMGFSRQEHWSGFPCPPPGDLPNPGIEPVSLKSPALTGGFFTTSATWDSQVLVTQSCPTLFDPMDCSPPGSSVCGILQARTLEWVGCHFLLQGIFLTSRSSPHLPHCRWSKMISKEPIPIRFFQTSTSITHARLGRSMKEFPFVFPDLSITGAAQFQHGILKTFVASRELREIKLPPGPRKAGHILFGSVTASWEEGQAERLLPL